MAERKLGLGTICVRLLDELYAIKKDQVSSMVIVETGTLKDAEHEPGWDTEERSTLAIAEWINSKRAGMYPKFPFDFFSIDSSPGNIATSKKVVGARSIDALVEWREGDGRAQLETINSQIDFALLDSDTDPKIIHREFEWIHKMSRWPCLCVIDDVYDKGDVNKGSLAIPQADRYRFPHARIGHTAVVAFGALAENIIEKVAKEFA